MANSFIRDMRRARHEVLIAVLATVMGRHVFEQLACFGLKAVRCDFNVKCVAVLDSF